MLWILKEHFFVIFVILLNIFFHLDNVETFHWKNYINNKKTFWLFEYCKDMCAITKVFGFPTTWEAELRSESSSAERGATRVWISQAVMCFPTHHSYLKSFPRLTSKLAE